MLLNWRIAFCVSFPAVVFGLQKFEPATNVDAFFVEQFTYESLESSPWKTSKAVKDSEFQFNGVVNIEVPKVFNTFRGDKALVLKSKAQLHGVTRMLPETLDPKYKTLVIQYEVKLQDGLDCGGAYIKLLKKEEGKNFDPEQFSDQTPYVIMFGPDKCGTDNKVHFIFKHKNPLTGEYEEKHLKTSPSMKSDKITNLYTLIVRPDNSFSILINMKEIKTGNLLQDFKPSVNPQREIDDPNDVKPDDWVDEEYVVDESAVKPDDWDESEPREIPDVDAIKPDGWMDDEPEYIRDPEAKMPEDWSEEEDGEYEAPMIRNPKCSVGCGEWKVPKVKNPKYKGKWSPPKVENPLFIGKWAPRKIRNPDFYEDLHPHNFEPIDAIGFEIWTMNEGITFDNIYIGFDEKKAKKFAEETFAVKFKFEKTVSEKEMKDSAKAESEGGSNIGGIVRKWAEDILFTWKTESLVAAFLKNPNAVIGLALITITPFMGIYLAVFLYNRTMAILPKKNPDNIDDLADVFKDFPVKSYEKRIRQQIAEEELKSKGEEKKIEELADDADDDADEDEKEVGAKIEDAEIAEDEKDETEGDDE